MLAAVFISPCTPSFNVFLAHSFSRFTVPLLAPSVVFLLIIAFFFLFRSLVILNVTSICSTEIRMRQGTEAGSRRCVNF